jgi:HNH endonuclease
LLLMPKHSSIFPESLRKSVAQRAGYRCEYCRIPQKYVEYSFHLDHIISLKHGGQTELANLAYSCPDCNYNKGSNLGTYLNPSVRDFVPLFHPRIDLWADHFKEEDGAIIPLTKVGEATVKVLLLNLPERILLRRELSKP